MNSPSSQHSRLARNFAWLSLNELFIRLIGLVTAIYLARTLSPTSYGQLGIALSIVAIVGTLVQAGTGTRATRQTALDPAAVPEIYAEINAFRMMSAIACIAILVLLAPLMSEILAVPAPLLILCALLLLRNGLTVVWAFRGLDRMHVITVAETVEKALVLLGVVLLVHGEGNDILWAPAIELAAALSIVWWLRYRLGRLYQGLVLEFRLRAWPAIAREAVPFGMAGLISALYLNATVPLLGWLGRPEAAATFLVAQKLMLTLALPLMVINQAAFPSVSRLLTRPGNAATTGPLADANPHDNRGALELQAVMLRYYLLLTAPLIPLAFYYSGDLLTLVFGEQYRAAGPILAILVSALPFLAVNEAMVLLLRAIPRPALVLSGRAAGIGVLLTIAMLLIPRFGALGAAIAVVAAESLLALLFSVLVWRAAGGLPLNLRCLSPIAAGLAAVAVFYLTDSWPTAARLTIALATYLMAALFSRAISVVEIRMLARLLKTTIRQPFS